MVLKLEVIQENMENNFKQSGFEDDDEIVEVCRDSSHNPPMHLYIPEGKKYRHVCPGCGKELIIRGNQITFTRILE